MNANGFIVAGKGSAPADDVKAADLTESADGLKAVDWADCPELDVDDESDGLKAADCPELDEADVAGEEESAAAEGGGAPHPLSQPAAPPLPLMGVAELFIELVPLVLPVTVLLFGWFGGAWLE